MANPQEILDTNIVFVETNLNINIALIVHKDDTASVFKDKLRSGLKPFYPESYDIQVTALKVRRRERFHHVSDSMNLFLVFQSITTSDWFLFADAYKVEKTENETANASLPLAENPSLEEGLQPKVVEKKTKKKRKSNTLGERKTRKKHSASTHLSEVVAAEKVRVESCDEHNREIDQDPKVREKIHGVVAHDHDKDAAGQSCVRNDLPGTENETAYVSLAEAANEPVNDSLPLVENQSLEEGLKTKAVEKKTKKRKSKTLDERKTRKKHSASTHLCDVVAAEKVHVGSCDVKSLDEHNRAIDQVGEKIHGVASDQDKDAAVQSCVRNDLPGTEDETAYVPLAEEPVNDSHILAENAEAAKEPVNDSLPLAEKPEMGIETVNENISLPLVGAVKEPVKDSLPLAEAVKEPLNDSLPVAKNPEAAKESVASGSCNVENLYDNKGAIQQDFGKKVDDVEGHLSSSNEISTEAQVHVNAELNEEKVVKEVEWCKCQCTCKGQKPKKLIILDLNGILIDIVQGYKGRTAPDGFTIFKRPFLDSFLDFCFKNFVVAIWSSRLVGLDYMVDGLMRNRRDTRLLFRFDQRVCTETKFKCLKKNTKPIFLKDLRVVWYRFGRCFICGNRKYDESNTLLIDDSPDKALCNPRYSGIFPFTYEHASRHSDNSLGPDGELRKYLERLIDAKNVQQFVKENPIGQEPITDSHEAWDYYSKVVQAHKYSDPNS
ncbi:unnamed protein product [Cochlearia groenlandica]